MGIILKLQGSHVNHWYDTVIVTRNYNCAFPAGLVTDIVSWYEQGIMLVYDITNERSFENIKNWIRNIEEVRHTVASLYFYAFQSAAEFL